MRAKRLMETIIRAHETNNDSEITLRPHLMLKPMLDYKGLMARRAYLWNRRSYKKTRPYAGLLDFKILYKNEGIEHEKDVILPAVRNLPIESVRTVHNGYDPVRIKGITKEQKDIACCMQAAFLEQEINRGEHPFQLMTYFGRKSDVRDSLLINSAPRDFQMVFIERCFFEVSSTGRPPDDVVAEIVSPFREYSKAAGSEILMPPLENERARKKRVLEEFRHFVPCSINNKPTTKWIDVHIPRITNLCRTKGKNPQAV